MLKNGFSWVKEALMLLGIAITAVGAIILGAPAVVTGVVAGIVAAVATLVVAVKGHWEEIKKFLSEAIAKIKEFGGNIVKGLFEGIKKAITNVGTWLKEHLVDPIVNLEFS